MTDETHLRRAAREIFDAALKSADAGRAVHDAVRLEGSRLKIAGATFALDARPVGIYALAVGKAAFPMAHALDKILRDKITAGLVVGASTVQTQQAINPAWRILRGSHPLPDEASLGAAGLAFELLQRANAERALIIFLISGGGSAMIEWPRDERTTLEDLREANRALVSCGASIAEINAVRRAFSAVKGGGLAARAPQAEQVSLIVSDTGRGQESIVASGPTCTPLPDAPDALFVIERYNLGARLPQTILRAVNQGAAATQNISAQISGKHYVLLDNNTALEEAAAAARRLGFAVEIAPEISEQPIAEGCSLMLSRLSTLRRRAGVEGRDACLISGGEFSCPVQGDGLGGRNAETVLRCLIEVDEMTKRAGGEDPFGEFACLSAGTDGIDGNSPATGAIADHATVRRGRGMNLIARSFLDRSDAFSFFNALGGAIITGPTGTNVRDVRVLLAKK